MLINQDLPRAKILTDLEEQLRNWSINEDSADSEGTASTLPTPHVSIPRHQKTDSQDTIKGGKIFTEQEVVYLNYVLDALYILIVGRALDPAGVQYRSTFAWKFQVPPSLVPADVD
jgi:hypothetical protein